MEFWGVEVKAGETLKVEPDFGQIIHISQAAIGEVKDVKGAKRIPLHVNVDSKKYVIGTLSAEDRPQVMFDLVFERKFELSHGWKSGSVYFVGYMAEDQVPGEDGFSDESEDEEYPFDAPLMNGGESEPKVEDLKPSKEKPAAVKTEEGPESDESEDDDEDGDGESDDLSDGDDSENDLQDMSDDEPSEEETPKKAQKSNKKRPSSALETPVSNKKAKNASSGKQGNKSVHNATPYPSKKGGKTPAGNKRK